MAAGASLAKDVNKVVMGSVPLLVAAKGGLLPDDAGAAPLAVAGMASSADFAGVASSPDFAGRTFPAIAGVVPPAKFSEKTYPDVALYPENVELGEPSEVVQPCSSERWGARG